MSNDNFEHSFSSCTELQQTILPSSGIAFGLAVRSGMRSTASQGVNRTSGFTLIELMVVVVIVAIFAAIAIPSYQAYVRRAVASQTQQEMQRISALLERHKSRNFSYQKFDLSTQGVTAPRTYSFDLKDGATGNADLKISTVGRTWVLKATTTDAKNFNYLLTSTGIRCKNITAANITYSTCGAGGETW